MTRYHILLVTLHWLLALMIIAAMAAGGLVLENIPNNDPFKLTALAGHMILGLGILLLMLIRLAVRLRTAHPPRADIGNHLLNRGADLAHWLFYIVVIAMSA